MGELKQRFNPHIGAITESKVKHLRKHLTLRAKQLICGSLNYAPTSNTEEAEVEWFYEDLQELLEHPKKMSFSSQGTGTLHITI